MADLKPIGGTANSQDLNDNFSTLDAQLAETKSPESFVNLVQSTIPSKKGLKTNTHKIIRKNGDNNFTIIQKKNKEYILYNFDISNGDTGSASVGGSWDLLRIKKAKSVAMAYVAKSTFTNTETLTTLYAPSTENNFETQMFSLNNTIPTEAISNDSGNGLGVYGISSTTTASTATFSVKVGTKQRANAVIFGSSGSTANADILVNGEVVESLDPTKIATGTTVNYKVIEFEIPRRYLGDTVDITLRNNDTSDKKLYFAGVNFYELDKYDGQDIDMHKAIVKDEIFIDTNGASDYAIYDNDLGKWVGSYHGGETRTYGTMNWTSDYSKNFDVEARFTTVEITDTNITYGDWIVTKDFKFFQVTDLNSKAKMISEFNFNTDGTIEMTFSLYNSTINTKHFYTALTSTHKDFNYIHYPEYVMLADGVSDKKYLKLSEGYTKQVNRTKKIELDIRFTKFNNYYDGFGVYILNDSAVYRKFYYGLVTDYTNGVIIPNVTFTKALDFIKQ